MPRVIVPVGLELGPDHPAEGEPSAFSGKLGYQVDFSPGTVTLDFEAHTSGSARSPAWTSTHGTRSHGSG